MAVSELIQRIAEWIDSRVGLTNTMLRRGPDYSLNVFYWLGALMVMAFILQGITGLLMLLYYTPTVSEAYSSTLFIMNYVPLGGLIETIHLYSAYAMVLLTFMHLIRGYFVSAQKKPRELMWVVGMLMGLVTLGFGLTGYLLPWTVVSKSATDVTIGMISLMPGQLGPALKFLIAGPGSDAAELARFFDLHVVLLPAVFLLLLVFKMYMFEIHGAAEPATGVKGDVRDIPWFPNIFLYFAMLSAIFLALLIAVSVVFPISLPPEFTPAAASTYTPQPEWYFLWIYQILKFSAFEGAWITVPLGLTTILLLLLIALPFLDRRKERNPSRRPVYTTLGVIAVVEVVVLTVWGYFTPGQVIPDSDATIITSGVAVVIAVISWITYRTRNQVTLGHLRARSFTTFMGTPFRAPTLTAVFVILLAVSSASFATFVNLIASPWSMMFVATLTIAVFSLLAMVFVVKRLSRSHIFREDSS
jgi:quinol-cytochrome oxidoreductase complex cytochrome b subunit